MIECTFAHWLPQRKLIITWHGTSLSGWSHSSADVTFIIQIQSNDQELWGFLCCGMLANSLTADWQLPDFPSKYVNCHYGCDTVIVDQFTALACYTLAIFKFLSCDTKHIWQPFKKRCYPEMTVILLNPTRTYQWIKKALNVMGSIYNCSMPLSVFLDIY